MDNVEQLRAELQRVDELLALLQNAAGAGVALRTLLQNRVQQTALSGAVVAAAGAITLDAALTTVGPLGKIRISAHFSGTGGGGAGGVNAILQVKIGAGAFATVYSWAGFPTGVDVDLGTVFEFDSAAAPGTVLTVHWQTTAGDDAVTLGGAVGAGILGAVLLVEELP
jgi:hypothetical protein